MEVSHFIQHLKADSRLASQIVHHEVLPARPADFQEPEGPLDQRLINVMHTLGIRRLYSHQAKAYDLIRRGKNVAVATPTASGKTLTYTLAVFARLLEDPDTRALYLFPLKALEQDQKKVVDQWAASLSTWGEFTSAIYDGDTPSHKRKKIRASPPHVLISNPDMLHLSILAYHEQWRGFLQRLKIVVMDELHTYRGVFGSHVLQVMRRLRRLCAHYGTSVQFVALSATIGNVGELAEKITGVPFEVVEESGAPRACRHVLFVNPAESPYTVATRIFKEAVDRGFKTIAFTQARKITELIHSWVIQDSPHLACRVSSYRAGFLPEERREIERKLFEGEMDGVISTSALELGIDIGGLDVCVLVGYPGTITATWQRGGRVGRAQRESLIVMVAQPDALDQYIMRNPHRFFQGRFENAVVDPENKKILQGHLACAAAEIPLHQEDPFVNPTGPASRVIAEMERERLLLRSADGTRWFSPTRRPHRNVDIRSVGDTYTIIDEESLKVVGSSSGRRVFSECHEGAIYMHRAEHYLVRRMDLAEKNIYVRPVKVNYYTRARSEKDTEILEVYRSKPVGNFILRQGRLKVTERITSYEKRRILGQELLSTHPLDLPPLEFETVGIWLEIEEFIRKAVEGARLHLMGGIHAVEHAIIALFPLFALCDRDDVGGISIPMHPQIGKAAIFVYDGYQDGVGLSERAYEVIRPLLEAVLTNVQSCGCEEGCPGCIHSPKCGSGNKPLDKEAAVLILKALLDLEPVASLTQPQGPASHEEEGGSPTRGQVQHQAVGPPPPPRILFFDLETQRSAQEVGGWENKHLMRMSVGVIYDMIEDRYLYFHEEEVEQLISLLRSADLVVGFNVRRFDYRVLSAYCQEALERIPTFDMLEEIRKGLGFRLSLDHLAAHTLGERKLADGLQAVEWFKEGRMEELREYCRKDVELTLKLFRFGCDNAYLLYEAREGQVVRLPVQWDIGEIIRRLKGGT